ncbi:flavin monoamine oxidase family protein [Sorangium cellulosum]|uniref:flavin monoamine oxidase family protein n=1 Tax=Sorangium cellulosum TaxID=56 RepID=UPI00133180E5|nr:NAD(P)/FAD-dependent oxidoreductase [Sorangium cellulosum]
MRRAIDKLKHKFNVERLEPNGRARNPKGRVLVVGGGFGGLSAAYLLSNWFDVTVLEASGRLGGRVHSRDDFTPGRTIEFGAELIGWNHPLWLHFAERFGLGLSMLTDESSFSAMGMESPLYLNGRLLDNDTAEQVYNEMTEAFKSIEKDAKRIEEPYKPWRAPNARELDATSLSDWLEKVKASALTKAAIQAQFENNNGVPLSRQSYLGAVAAVAGSALWYDDKLDAYWEDSEVARCSAGNQGLAIELGNRIGASSGCGVRLNAPVRAVTIRDGGVEVEADGLGRIEADFVIFAVPPTMWPTIRVTPEITFAPQLGKVVKYFSNVRSRFWYGDRRAPTALDDAFGMTWEGTDNQIGGAGFTLSVFAGSKAAEAAIAAPDARAFYDERIGAVYPSYRQNLEKSELMNWEAAEWTRGGYSVPAPNQVTTVGKLVNKPFHERLFFAGEHVCIPYFGYMEGALESGLLAARRVLKKAAIELPAD